MASPCAPQTPQEAGHATLESLLKAAKAHPDLRPCPKYRGSHGTMNWIYRTTCDTCPRNKQAEAKHE